MICELVVALVLVVDETPGSLVTHSKERAERDPPY
jgi:hypothetical protein